MPEKSTKLCFAFRVDAGIEIGIGHLMRCLTLADTLSANGHSCHFLISARQGDRRDIILNRGHTLHLLPNTETGDYGQHPNPPAHAAWLAGGWQQDALACLAIFIKLAPDWVVVDHYGLDEVWEQVALPTGVRLLVIDDLADRPHRADLLLDQNLGRKERDYVRLIPKRCTVLAGPRYALLRAEFAQKRPEAIVRRKLCLAKHLLITLGGVDKDNATGAVLAALSNTPLPTGFHITVVMGRQAPFLEDVQRKAKGMPCPTKVLIDVSDMASLMVESDLCIGAAGSTAWERCVLGLPTAMLVLAGNQTEIAWHLENEGCGIILRHWSDPEFARELAKSLDIFKNSEKFAGMVKSMLDVTQGKGCVILCERLSMESAQYAS